MGTERLQLFNKTEICVDVDVVKNTHPHATENVTVCSHNHTQAYM